MSSDQLHVIILGAVAALATQILMGKFLKRLILLPFEYWASKTNNPVDDKLLDEAEKDLGITDRTISNDTITKK